ncbi:response regulator transcription factor [Variovorax saccharolyticus]|uniref:response regulator transcription factor n=1 Tax=Variovorax saccharolyticus TaxID=3053516 RepID=UPI002577BBF4|nr:response regulator [Variovorax sp. J22R187]MDM0019520.1 response regulator [Variovorax sp. J22R187]
MRPTPVIHVVDDDEQLRIALLRLLNAAGFEARGYAATGEFLLHPLPDHAGCLLLDVNLPGPSGLELQEVLRQHGCLLPVVFLTGRDDVPSSVRAMKAGAVDFLQKPVQADTLIAALQRALAQDESQRAAREARQRLAALFATLTPREQEVFDRIVAGRLNKQIADELHTSERTVKTQRSQLMSKLGVESAAELGRLAEQRQASGLGVASLSGNELAPAPDSAPAMRTR